MILGFAGSGLLSGVTFKPAVIGDCEFTVAFSDIWWNLELYLSSVVFQ
jgi:hypothetical protein